MGSLEAVAMRLIRPEMSWRVLVPDNPAGSICLQRLVLRHGYRVEEICSQLACTRSYLHRVFIRDIGLPPKEWMRRERMVVARRMLIGGREPVEVAEVLGFATQNNFRREFLEIHRVPPLRFQQEAWGNTGIGNEIRPTLDGVRIKARNEVFLGMER